jgi:DNA-binding NtrC family response regulator
MDAGDVLLISDGSQIFPPLARFLTEAGHRVMTTGETRQAFQSLRAGNFRLVITCLSNGWTDTRPFLKAVRDLNREIAVVILRPGPQAKSPVGAYLVKDEGYDFKPFGWPGLRHLVANCLSS